jgi:hypothetical protein
VYGLEITTCRNKGLLHDYVIFLLWFPNKWSPLVVLSFPALNRPSCTMWFRQFTKNVTRTNHKVWCHPHSTEHDTWPTTYLISKQVVPCWTRGGTCCPEVCTPMIQSLVDSSMTNHITKQNPTVSTIPTLLKPWHRSSPRSNHILMDERPSVTKTQAKLNITNDGKTCTTLMTAWLSITNQVRTQILCMRLRYSIKACWTLCTLDKEREHIGSIWSRVTCRALPLAATQSLECRAPRDCRSLWHLKVSIGNKQYKQINKQYTKQCLITKQTLPKDATRCYERVSATFT